MSSEACDAPNTPNTPVLAPTESAMPTLLVEVNSMDGLTVKLAESWEQVEEYAGAINSCIKLGRLNWTTAKDSWEKDTPRPIYVLLDYQGYKGYIRFLAIAGFLWSDYYGMGDLSNLDPESRAAIWLEAVRFLGQPCLSSHSIYGGRTIKWFGPGLPYRRVNSYPYHSTVWLIFPDDIGGVAKELPSSLIPLPVTFDC